LSHHILYYVIDLDNLGQGSNDVILKLMHVTKISFVVNQVFFLYLYSKNITVFFDSVSGSSSGQEISKHFRG